MWCESPGAEPTIAKRDICVWAGSLAVLQARLAFPIGVSRTTVGQARMRSFEDCWRPGFRHLRGQLLEAGAAIFAEAGSSEIQRSQIALWPTEKRVS